MGQKNDISLRKVAKASQPSGAGTRAADLRQLGQKRGRKWLRKKRAGRKKRRWGWKIALALLLLLALGLGGLYAAGRVVHVRYATVFLRDLPSAFEGTTILFVSDIDAHSAGTPAPPRR